VSTPRKIKAAALRWFVSPLGLRQRLFVALALPLIVILSVSSLADYSLARETSDLAHDTSLADDVLDIETHLRAAADGHFDLSEEVAAILRSNAPDQVYFSVRNDAGSTLAGDESLPVLVTPMDGKVAFSNGFHQGRPVRIAIHRVVLASAPLTITVMETTQKRSESRHRLLTAMLLPNLAVIAACLLAVLFGVRQGLLPLNELEREIAERSPDDLRLIDLDSIPREIRPMVRRLNELFAMLREASEAQNRFIGDAAHQIRTPMAALQAQVDLAVAEGVFSGNSLRQRNIEEGTERLGRLINQLLAYARAEASASGVDKRDEVALEVFVERSASTFLDAALSKDIDLGFDIAPAKIQGVSWLLQEALGNLVDNAIRYTPRGGIVTVRCGTEGGRAFFEVEDNGPGIPQELRQRVFERFYRVSESGGNGCGLGLPIVQEIAELHGAKVALLTAEQGGLRIRLEFA
jgi:two-component system sensor histidine kinase TctE